MDKILFFNKKNKTERILTVVIVVLLSLGVYLSLSVWDIKKSLDKQEYTDQELIEDVGKLILLPKDESPIITTLRDGVTINRDLEFFRNAKNDDKLIVFRSSGKAILYRPSDKIIVEVSSVNVTNDLKSQNTAELKDDQNTFSISIRYDKSISSDVASLLKNAILSSYGEFVSSIDIQKSVENYTESLLYSSGNTENLNQFESKLIEKFSLKKQENFPKSEQQFQTNIVIIIGQNFSLAQ